MADRQLESSASENAAQKLPISRWGVGEVAVGRRVIVRHALTDEEALASGKKTTDVIGHVLSMDPFVVRPQVRAGVRADESVAAVDFSDKHILIVKALPDHPVRNSDIRAVETATAKAFPGIAHVVESGWLLRAGDGITERSNSALPLEPGASTQPVPLEKIKSFYDSHDLPVRIAIPDRIAKPAQALVAGPEWTVGPDIVVMTRSLDGDLPPAELAAESHSAVQVLDEHSVELADVQVDIADQPDDDWLGLYHFRGTTLPEHALQLLRNEIDGRMCFGRLQVPDNNAPEGIRTVAITRGTLTESDDGRVWLGFSAVEVAADMRRRGLGTLLGIHMMHWGTQHGADSAYLQVLGSNEAGIALYRTLGFTEHHRHRYAELTGA
ncbi:MULTISPECIES: GNAT family N-acetyltransferase [unclassified Corynebacterium]|uniref:N-acetylglutamate synthase, CG3035 family n=1 Tax=unclassified Corynebacterium TaxID=2624378 RepID=UPI0009F1D9AA|nr:MULTISPECIES: GNAT family N-acetyltransferase [unclassified Corynebacterium]MDU3110215.1 GNAT family N-acetyltransferase [Corynebacterium sp.]